MFQREYEENEAPPPRLDAYAKDGVLEHGQYLFKNQVYNQDIIKKMADQKKQEEELKRQRSDVSGASVRRRSTMKKMVAGVGLFKNTLKAKETQKHLDA